MRLVSTILNILFILLVMVSILNLGHVFVVYTQINEAGDLASLAGAKTFFSSYNLQDEGAANLDIGEEYILQKAEHMATLTFQRNIEQNNLNNNGFNILSFIGKINNKGSFGIPEYEWNVRAVIDLIFVPKFLEQDYLTITVKCSADSTELLN